MWKKLWVVRTGLALLAALLLSGIPAMTAAAQEETELQEVSPGAKGGGSISSLEGWEEVESYWRELETEIGEFLPRWDIGDIWERDEGGLIPGIGEIL